MIYWVLYHIPITASPNSRATSYIYLHIRQVAEYKAEGEVSNASSANRDISTYFAGKKVRNALTSLPL